MTDPDFGPPPSMLRLERFRLGELPDEDMEAIRHRAAGDEVLRARLLEFDRSDAQVAETYPARHVVAAIRQRQDAERRRRPLGWAWAVPAAVALVLALAVWRPTTPVGTATDEATVIKGDSLVMHRRTGDSSEALVTGAHVRQGDQIRVGYRSDGRPYGAILSVDTRGVVTQHLPTTGSRAAALTGGSTVLLDSSYELDDSPGWERFYLVTSSTPFELAPVREAVRAVSTLGTAASAPALKLPSAFTQCSFTLRKD